MNTLIQIQALTSFNIYLFIQVIIKNIYKKKYNTPYHRLRYIGFFLI